MLSRLSCHGEFRHCVELRVDWRSIQHEWSISGTFDSRSGSPEFKHSMFVDPEVCIAIAIRSVQPLLNGAYNVDRVLDRYGKIRVVDDGTIKEPEKRLLVAKNFLSIVANKM